MVHCLGDSLWLNFALGGIEGMLAEYQTRADTSLSELKAAERRQIELVCTLKKEKKKRQKVLRKLGKCTLDDVLAAAAAKAQKEQSSASGSARGMACRIPCDLGSAWCVQARR